MRKKDDMALRMNNFLRFSLFVIGIGAFVMGRIQVNREMAFWGMFLVFLSNLFYGFAKGNTRFIFLFFHLAIFTFLVSRPFILNARGQDWVWYSKPATDFATMLLFFMLITLRVGAFFGEELLHRIETLSPYGDGMKPETAFKTSFRENLQIVSLIVFAVTLIASYATGLDKILFMRGREYGDYFSLYEASLPGVITMVASMAKYAYCIYLATLPKKKPAIFVSILFLIDAVPSFIVGIRNPLIMRMLVCLTYFIFRTVSDKKEKWIGTIEKALMAVCVPVGIAGLGIFGYIREGDSHEGGLFGQIVQFFYDQGTSFDTIRNIFKNIDKLPDEISKNYTFGPIHEYIFNGSIAQKFFGAMNLGNNNSEIKAVYGRYLAHSAYYGISKDKYLAGRGFGSNYALENYIDWGWAGVIIFGILVGMGLIFLVFMMRRGIFARTVAITTLLELYFMPRAEAVTAIQYLVYIQFWFTLIVIYFAAALCVKKYSLKSSKSIQEKGDRLYV